jgi:hypothetical protein
METLNNFVCTIYTRKVEKDRGQFVEWVVKQNINQFPKLLSEITFFPYMFSPSFRLQLDFSYLTNQFVIKDVEKQEIYLRIPSDLISLKDDKVKGENAIKLLASKMRFLAEDKIRILNHNNIDTVFQIVIPELDDDSADNRYLKLLSAVKVDNQFLNKKKLDFPHLYCDGNSLESRDVLERLIH